MFCLDVRGDILSPPLFSAVSACGPVGVWRESEMKGGRGRVEFVFSFPYLLSPVASEGSTRGKRCRRDSFLGPSLFGWGSDTAAWAEGVAASDCVFVRVVFLGLVAEEFKVNQQARGKQEVIAVLP